MSTIHLGILSIRRDVTFQDNSVYIEGVGQGRKGSYSITQTERDHQCGLTGYNPELGDHCGGCDEERDKSTILRQVVSSLEEAGILN